LSAITRTSDIVVIGGGIMGASIAWHLARKGAGKVTLLERSTIAAGASGKTGALLRQHYTNRPEATLAHLSLQVFRNWPEIVGGDCGFVESGLVFTLPKGPALDKNLESLWSNVVMQRKIGIKTRILSPGELFELQPYLCVEDLAAATLEEESGCVDAFAATRAMTTAAMNAAVDVVENCEAVSILTSGDRVEGVETSSGTIQSPVVICASGPWSKAFLLTAGVDVPISALRVQVAVFNRPLSMERPHASYIDASLGLFIRPWSMGRTMVGMSGGDQHDEVDPNKFDHRNSDGYGQLVIDRLAKRMPLMAHATYSHGYACLYDMTPDAHPIIGPAGPDGLYVVAGFSETGFKKGPAVGLCVAEMITDGKATNVDLSPFAFNRFSRDTWKQQWSETEYVLESDFGHKF